MVKQSKTGEKRLSKAARTRIETYYVERVWGEGSEFVEELMLWVPPSTRPPPYPPPALLPPQTLFHILTTFQHFCNRGQSSCTLCLSVTHKDYPSILFLSLISVYPVCVSSVTH